MWYSTGMSNTKNIISIPLNSREEIKEAVDNHHAIGASFLDTLGNWRKVPLLEGSSVEFDLMQRGESTVFLLGNEFGATHLSVGQGISDVDEWQLDNQRSEDPADDSDTPLPDEDDFETTDAYEDAREAWYQKLPGRWNNNGGYISEVTCSYLWIREIDPANVIIDFEIEEDTDATT